MNASAGHHFPRYQGLIARYGDRMDIRTDGGVVTLLEGSTPLIPAQRLADRIAPGGRLFLKFEGANPTGSFKDRGMTAAVTDALAAGSRSVICASTGNTAASAAAYAARAGLRCAVVLPEGKVAHGKLAGAIAYGAEVIPIRGSFDDALAVVRHVCASAPITLVNSLNPARIEGQKTAAFEIAEELGDCPDWLALPVGNAGNITSCWKGFREARDRGDCNGTPSLLGVQAAGSAPIVLGRPIPRPETCATAIRIGNPARWREAEAALRESNGRILAVTDEAIMSGYRLVAATEGVFCEPASAASVAGLAEAVRQDIVAPEGRTIVCMLTGHGMKDPEAAIRSSIAEPVALDAVEERLLRLADDV